MASGLVITQYAGVSVVNFQNSAILDAAAVDAIGNELYGLIDKQAHRKIVLDFSEVKFLSSQMLGILIAVHKKASDIKGKVVICGLRPEIFKVFQIMKLDKMLNFAPDEQTAMEQFDIFMK